MPGKMIVFDMDGVLVDVTGSYREAIIRTVEHFTGRQVERALVQDYKNRGGWNNDWALSQKISADLGFPVDYDTVVAYFQSIFLGDGSGGLIEREKWIARPGVLERLAERHRLAVFTGRPRDEAAITLRRFASGLVFDPVVGDEDVERAKPAPDGLLKIASLHPGVELCYVGDTVDDARSARAAGVPFIGIAAAGKPRREELVRLLEQEQAKAVLEDINGLEAVLA